MSSKCAWAIAGLGANGSLSVKVGVTVSLAAFPTFESADGFTTGANGSTGVGTPHEMCVVAKREAVSVCVRAVTGSECRPLGESLAE